MAEDFDPCHFLDVAGSTSRTVKVWPGSNTILSNWLCSLERVDLKDTFDAHRVLIHKSC
jgi:hypothetical protein